MPRKAAVKKPKISKKNPGSAFHDKLLDTASFYLAAAGVIIAVLIIYRLPFAKAAPAAADELLPFLTAALRPEPAERLAYIFSLIFFPVFFIAAKLLLPGIMPAGKNEKTVFSILTAFNAAAFILLVLAAFGKNAGYISDNAALGHLPGFMAAFVIMAALFLAGFNRRVAGFVEKYRLEYLYLAADAYAVYLACQYFCYSVFNLSDIDNVMHHFDAFFYSVVQVCSGKTLLSDFTNQYGLYPDFLCPFIKMTGPLTVVRFTAMMGVISVAALVSMYLFLRNTVKNKFVLFFGFIAMLYFSFFRYKIFFSTDPYFQYFPLRVIFPALELLLMSFYFKRPGRLLYYPILVLAAMAVLWNADSGIVTFIAVVMGLIYSETADSGTAADPAKKFRTAVNAAGRHAVRAAAVFFFVFAAYLSAIFMRSGKIPDLLSSFKYQAVFYGMGANMLPMPGIHPWNIFALFAALGLAVSISYLMGTGEGRVEPFSYKALFFLTVLGAGLFSYYQGRSHDDVFAAIAFLMIMMMIVSADILIKEIKLGSRGIYADAGGFLALLTILFMFTSTSYTMLKNLGVIMNRTKGISQKLKNPGNNEQVNFIRAVTVKGEGIVILSQYTAVYYAESGTYNPLAVPGNIEMLLKRDAEKIAGYAREDAPGRKIIADLSYLALENITLNPKFKIIRSDLIGNFVCMQQPAGLPGVMPAVPARLGTAGEIFHAGRESLGMYYRLVKGKISGERLTGRTTELLKLGGRFSIDIIVSPAGISSGYRELAYDFDSRGGFMIMSDNEEKGFVLTLATDKGIYVSRRIDMDAGRWNLITTAFDGSRVSVYLNGIKKVSDKFKGKFLNSGEFLHVGYNLQEIAFYNRVMTEKEALADYENVRKNMENSR